MSRYLLLLMLLVLLVLCGIGLQRWAIDEPARFDVTAIASPPTVTMRVGKPVDLEYRSEERDTERIMEAIMSLLPPEARAPREPTDEELARTLPPGVSAADVLDESTRRPGTD